MSVAPVAGKVVEFCNKIIPHAGSKSGEKLSKHSSRGDNRDYLDSSRFVYESGWAPNAQLPVNHCSACSMTRRASEAALAVSMVILNSAHHTP